MALTDTFVRQVKHRGGPNGEKYADSNGMYLHVSSTGKYWRLAYRYLGKQRTLALGTYPTLSLAKARKDAEQAKTLLKDGIDPSRAKRDEIKSREAAAIHTFERVARDWLDKTASSRAPSTQTKVSGWLEKDLIPSLGNLPISTIGPRDVLEALRKMETRGAVDSAHRVKQICGQVLRFAVACGLATRDVTADLKGALAQPPKRHFAAIVDPDQVGALLRAIHSYHGHPYSVAALKLAPLVFVRPGELRTAEWSEIDLDAAEWRIPGRKMKMGLDHIVPLSRQAVELFASLKPMTGDGVYVFPSIRTSARPMSENTLNAALRNLGYSKDLMVAHGFRAMARTLLDEVLEERVEYIEHQLAHLVKDPLGRAYNRTTHLPARRAMMQRWADYLDKVRAEPHVIVL